MRQFVRESYDPLMVHLMASWRSRQMRVQFRRSPSEAERVTLDGRNFEGGVPFASPSGDNRLKVAFG